MSGHTRNAHNDRLRLLAAELARGACYEVAGEASKVWTAQSRKAPPESLFPLEMATNNTQDSWLSSWPDALAFVVGLSVAWWGHWNAGDLVWSLWLSSFVVGYSIIVWMIAQPAAELARASWRDRALVDSNPKMLLTFWLILLIGVLFFLAFFTVHFGGFHYVHSQFLNTFFPIDLGGHSERPLSAGIATYKEVLRRYWYFLPSAFLAHRAAFLRKPLSLDRNAPLQSLAANKPGDLFAEPYRNVLRMHVLIFFFFFAHFAKLENFAVYAVVYAAYFFPWRLLRRPVTPAAEISLS